MAVEIFVRLNTRRRCHLQNGIKQYQIVAMRFRPPFFIHPSASSSVHYDSNKLQSQKEESSVVRNSFVHHMWHTHESKLTKCESQSQFINLEQTVHEWQLVKLTTLTTLTTENLTTLSCAQRSHTRTYLLQQKCASPLLRISLHKSQLSKLCLTSICYITQYLFFPHSILAHLYRISSIFKSFQAKKANLHRKLAKINAKMPYLSAKKANYDENLVILSF